MIRVNLARGERKPARGAGPKFTLRLPNVPSVSGAPSGWRLFALVAWILAPAAAGWTQWTSTRELAEIREAIEAERVDSLRFAALHAANAALRARQDTVQQRLAIIHEIDGGRFIWAHVMDEISIALPEHVWLTNVMFVSIPSGAHEPRFSIEGRSGSPFALTEFLQNLEASAFFDGVTLIGTSRVLEREVNVYSFVVEAHYRAPARGTLAFDAGVD